MCHDYEQHIRLRQYDDMMRVLELCIAARETEFDLPVAAGIRVNDLGPVMCAAENGIKLVLMNFGFPPFTLRGRPVFNLRSEGRIFEKSNRCLIPASAFFEFTGNRSPKARYRFTLNDAPFMAIAGIWRERKNGAPPAFTMLTTEAGPDVAPFCKRQVILLRPQNWAHWIYYTKPESHLFQTLPKGSLTVESMPAGPA